MVISTPLFLRKFASCRPWATNPRPPLTLHGCLQASIAQRWLGATPLHAGAPALSATVRTRLVGSSQNVLPLVLLQGHCYIIIVVACCRLIRRGSPKHACVKRSVTVRRCVQGSSMGIDMGVAASALGLTPTKAGYGKQKAKVPILN